MRMPLIKNERILSEKNPYGRIACICSGNNKVFYQSILTLLSVKKFNAYVDCFICTYTEMLSKNDYELLNLHSIKLLPIEEKIQVYLDQFKFNTGRWSNMIMLKCILPSLFEHSGYDYLIILDSDMLCLGKFDLEEMLPLDRVISWRRSGFLHERFTKDTWRIAAAYFQFDEDWLYSRKYFIPNGGFVAIKLKRFPCNEFFKRIGDIANFISNLTKGSNIDETAMAIFCWQNELDIKRVPEAYNCPIANRIIHDNVKIIHFAGSPKLWEASKIRKLAADPKDKNFNICVLLTSFMIYYNYAKKFNLLKLIFKDDYLSDAAILALMAQTENDYKSNYYVPPLDYAFVSRLVKRGKYAKAVALCQAALTSESKLIDILHLCEYLFLADNAIAFSSYFEILCAIGIYDSQLITKLINMVAYTGNFDLIKNILTTHENLFDRSYVKNILTKIDILNNFPSDSIGTWHGTILVWDVKENKIKHSDQIKDYIEAHFGESRISLYIKSLHKYIKEIDEKGHTIVGDEEAFFEINQYKFNNFTINCQQQYISARINGDCFLAKAPREWERFYLKNPNDK